jgi:hypothetical protein
MAEGNGKGVLALAKDMGSKALDRAREEVKTVPGESARRSAGRGIVKLCQKTALGIFRKSIGRGKEADKLYDKVEGFLGSDFGMSISGGVVSMIVHACPLGNEEKRRRLAHEISVEAGSIAWDKLGDVITKPIMEAAELFFGEAAPLLADTGVRADASAGAESAEAERAASAATSKAPAAA